MALPFLSWLFPSKPAEPGAPPFSVPLAPVPPEAMVAVRQRAAGEAEAPSAPLAPWPVIDRYPVILGSNVSLAYISSVFRLCITGYRREFCDLLDELLERDPHMYAVCAQRIHAVAGGDIQVTVADCDEADEDRAEEIRGFVERCIDRLPDKQQSLSQLQWGGLFYGVGAAETSWALEPADVNAKTHALGVPASLCWVPSRLHWIHSRRIAYPDPVSWEPRVWDQGMVASWNVAGDPTSQMFGLDMKDFPGKFVVHTPGVRGNYPTRDGLGRECAYWSALKLMGARGAAQYIERFGKPWVVGHYATGEEEKQHRSANDEDIRAIEAATKALGIGSLSSAVLPDSTSVELLGPGAGSTVGRQLMHVLWINACNAEMSKAVLGQTSTTEAGPNGSRAADEVKKQGTQELYRYDAACLADTLQRGLVKWIVALNFPGEEHLAPTLMLKAVEEPDLGAIVERAVKMATAGAPVDADALADEVGVTLVPKPAKPKGKVGPDGKVEEGVDHSPDGRRMYFQAPLKPTDVQDMMAMDRGEKLEPPPPPAGAFGGPPGTKPGASGAPGTNPTQKGATAPESASTKPSSE